MLTSHRLICLELSATSKEELFDEMVGLLAPKKYKREERESGKAAAIMGMIGISEGAIPFAAADPMRVIPAIVAGGIVGNVTGFLMQSVNHAPWGGWIVLPVVEGKPGLSSAPGSGRSPRPWWSTCSRNRSIKRRKSSAGQPSHSPLSNQKGKPGTRHHRLSLRRSAHLPCGQEPATGLRPTGDQVQGGNPGCQRHCQPHHSKGRSQCPVRDPGPTT